MLRAAFNWPIRGVYELVELLLAGTFFVALPCVFLRDENIVVNVDRRHRAARRCRGSSAPAELLAVVILAAMAWQGLIAARDSLEFNDVTADLGLPRFWHWLALLVGVIGAAPGCARDGAPPRRHVEGPAMSVAAIGMLGVALLLVLIFVRVPIAVALAASRACSAMPRSTAGRRR